jgi:hypothetical protein
MKDMHTQIQHQLETKELAHGDLLGKITHHVIYSKSMMH